MTTLFLCQMGAKRAMSTSFKPRRTPPPSVSGINLKPRADPMAAINKQQSPTTTTTANNNKPLGGAGRKDGWISPHHHDYYKRLDDSTLDHPELLHGDPHMPIQRLSRGDGHLVLNPFAKGKNKVKELNDYSAAGRAKDLFLDDSDNNNMNNWDDDDDGDDDIDELERDYGSDAADAIRQHLNTFHSRLNNAKEEKSDTYSPLHEIEEKFRTIDRVTAAKGSTQDLALMRRARTESREFFRLGRIPKVSEGDNGDDEFEVDGGNDDVDDGDISQGSFNGGEEKEFGHGRGYDAESVFSKSATVRYPYGKDLPSPTYHPDFPKGSNVGNNPNDPDEEKWMHELNKLIYEEQGKEMELGEIDETYSPVNIQKEEMNAYLKEKERTKKYNLLEREDEHEKDREEKPDQILEMIKNGEDPNQEAFGPW